MDEMEFATVPESISRKLIYAFNSDKHGAHDISSVETAKLAIAVMKPS